MIIKSKLWVIQKNIEEDEKSAQKKEEQEKEINESSLKFNGIQNSNYKVEFMDIYNSIYSN